jgi:hypothetical protein
MEESPTLMKTRATAEGWGESRKPGSTTRSVLGRGKQRLASSDGITSISSMGAGKSSCTTCMPRLITCAQPPSDHPSVSPPQHASVSGFQIKSGVPRAR